VCVLACSQAEVFALNNLLVCLLLYLTLRCVDYPGADNACVRSNE
jgi:hypothetical protein